MPSVAPTQITSDPQVHENEHVHAVYDHIASHFSSTRYKPWPIIAQFLADIPTGWVGLDSGTGNGKYLPLPLERPSGSIWTIGLDRSRNLLEIARNASGAVREVVWGDVLGEGWRHGAFDYAISIATIHHLATAERRMRAVQRLLQCVSPKHGRVLIYVWAVEQDDLSTRQIPDADADGAHEGRDVFVPWVLSQPKPTATKKLKAKRSRQGGSVDNEADVSPPIHSTETSTASAEPQVLNRYYHMFAAGELGALVRRAAADLGLVISARASGGEKQGVEIVKEGWERSNYYVELRRWE
ncbi:hypothetical protein PLICRDRAFT_41771 [Plicaturopsis crispa FD-325 SS-3]|nr:hypothetical protein PLICRDRAFT_41771 [Plicaturopsis crispa FD-325 SS-3]